MLSPAVIFMAEKESMQVGHLQVREKVSAYGLHQPIQQQVNCDDSTATKTTMTTALKTTSGTAVSIQDVKNQLLALRLQSSCSDSGGTDNDNHYTVYGSCNSYGRTPHPLLQSRVPRHRQNRKRRLPVFQGRSNAHQQTRLESVPEDQEFRSSSHTAITFSSMPALSLEYFSHNSDNENNAENYHHHTHEDTTTIGTTENDVEKAWQHVLASLKYMDSMFVQSMLEQLEKLGKDLNHQQMILFERQVDVLQMRMLIVDSMLKFEAKSNQIRANVSQLEEQEQRQNHDDTGSDDTNETALRSNGQNNVLSSSESSTWGSYEKSSTENDFSDVEGAKVSKGSRPSLRKYIAIDQTQDQFVHLPLLRAQVHINSPPPTTTIKVSEPPETASKSWWPSPLLSSSSPLCQHKKHYEEPELGKIVLPTHPRQTGDFVGKIVHPSIALDYSAVSVCVRGEPVGSDRKSGKEKQNTTALWR
jgi:hypothetical protein